MSVGMNLPESPILGLTVRIGVNGGNGPSWTIDLSRGPRNMGRGRRPLSSCLHLMGKPCERRGKWSETMRVMCNGVNILTTFLTARVIPSLQKWLVG